jgi:hypothetical protein
VVEIGRRTIQGQPWQKVVIIFLPERLESSRYEERSYQAKQDPQAFSTDGYNPFAISPKEMN